MNSFLKDLRAPCFHYEIKSLWIICHEDFEGMKKERYMSCHSERSLKSKQPLTNRDIFEDEYFVNDIAYEQIIKFERRRDLIVTSICNISIEKIYVNSSSL